MKITPDVQNIIAFLNYLEQVVSPSLVVGQDVSTFLVSGLTLVAAVAPRQALCKRLSISELKTATSLTVSESQCPSSNVTSTPVVLLGWNIQSNPFSAISNIVLTSGVIRLNARNNLGTQINASALTFTFKIYKQPAAWTSMISLAICVKWEYDTIETDGNWSAKNCEKISEDFDHLICSCTGLSYVGIAVIPKDCTNEPFGIPGFKADPSICIPDQIIPIAMIAGILSAVAIIGSLAFALHRRFRKRQELLRQHLHLPL